MSQVIKIDAHCLWDKRSVKVDVNVPGLYDFQVICGGRGWPTPCEVGIYLDAANRRCCIIDWPTPREPIRFRCEFGEFVVCLDTATEDEIRSAREVPAEFFRED